MTFSLTVEGIIERTMDEIEAFVRKMCSEGDLSVLTKKLIRTQYQAHYNKATVTREEKEKIKEVLEKVIQELADQTRDQPAHTNVGGNSNSGSLDQGKENLHNDYVCLSNSTSPSPLLQQRTRAQLGGASHVHKHLRQIRFSINRDGHSGVGFPTSRSASARISKELNEREHGSQLSSSVVSSEASSSSVPVREAILMQDKSDDDDMVGREDSVTVCETSDSSMSHSEDVRGHSRQSRFVNKVHKPGHGHVTEDSISRVSLADSDSFMRSGRRRKANSSGEGLERDHCVAVSPKKKQKVKGTKKLSMAGALSTVVESDNSEKAVLTTSDNEYSSSPHTQPTKYRETSEVTQTSQVCSNSESPNIYTRLKMRFGLLKSDQLPRRQVILLPPSRKSDVEKSESSDAPVLFDESPVTSGSSFVGSGDIRVTGFTTHNVFRKKPMQDTSKKQMLLGRKKIEQTVLDSGSDTSQGSKPSPLLKSKSLHLKMKERRVNNTNSNKIPLSKADTQLSGDQVRKLKRTPECSSSGSETDNRLNKVRLKVTRVAQPRRIMYRVDRPGLTEKSMTKELHHEQNSGPYMRGIDELPLNILQQMTGKRKNQSDDTSDPMTVVRDIVNVKQKILDHFPQARHKRKLSKVGRNLLSPVQNGAGQTQNGLLGKVQMRMKNVNVDMIEAISHLKSPHTLSESAEEETYACQSDVFTECTYMKGRKNNSKIRPAKECFHFRNSPRKNASVQKLDDEPWHAVAYNGEQLKMPVIKLKDIYQPKNDFMVNSETDSRHACKWERNIFHCLDSNRYKDKDSAIRLDRTVSLRDHSSPPSNVTSLSVAYKENLENSVRYTNSKDLEQAANLEVSRTVLKKERSVKKIMPKLRTTLKLRKQPSPNKSKNSPEVEEWTVVIPDDSDLAEDEQLCGDERSQQTQLNRQKAKSKIKKRKRMSSSMSSDDNDNLPLAKNLKSSQNDYVQEEYDSGTPVKKSKTRNKRLQLDSSEEDEPLQKLTSASHDEESGDSDNSEDEPLQHPAIVLPAEESDQNDNSMSGSEGIADETTTSKRDDSGQTQRNSQVTDDQGAESDLDTSSLSNDEENKFAVASSPKMVFTKKKTKQDRQNEKQKKTKAKSQNKDIASENISGEAPYLQRLRLICRKVGIFVRNSTHFAGCTNDGQKIERLKDALRKAGMKGQPSLSKVDSVNLKKEAAALDTSNIIETSGRPKRQRKDIFTRTNSPKKSLTSVKQQFNRIKDLISDSESD